MPIDASLWPYHPKPKPDELLSSWIRRTADGHGQLQYAFCHTVWPGRQILTRDIDLVADGVILTTMAEKTATSCDAAFSTTLAAYEGWLYERHYPRGRTKWILRSGVRSRNWRNAGLQYCPVCLATDESPYFRRTWRLALWAACPIHSKVLLDRCTGCGTHVMPHRSPEMCLCWNCGFDLRTAPTEPADFPALVLHRRHQTILSRGWAQLGEAHFASSHLYFDLVHQVMKTLSTGQRSARLREVVASRWGGNPRPFVFPHVVCEVEALGSADRHRLLALAARVLEGWPFRFVGAYAEARVWHSWAMRDLDDPPYAYEDEVRRYLHFPSYRPTREEIDAARAWLIRQQLPPSSRRIIRLFSSRRQNTEQFYSAMPNA